MKRYISTPNKDTIRKWNTTVIAKEFRRKKKKLAYFGMPSSEMKDVLEWRKYISRCSAVEINENQRNLMVLTINKNNLENMVTVLYGDVDEIIINGQDKFGNNLQFPYDLIFLDYYGGVIYKGFKRLDAIKDLLRKQKISFLFFLTYNIESSDYIRKQKSAVLNRIADEIFSWHLDKEKIKKNVENCIKWYKKDDTKDLLVQRIIVPYLLKKTSESLGYKVHSYSPIFYRGFENAPMIHFAFKMTYIEGSLMTPTSDQTVCDIINNSLKICDKGKIFNAKPDWPILVL